MEYEARLRQIKRIIKGEDERLPPLLSKTKALDIETQYGMGYVEQWEQVKFIKFFNGMFFRPYQGDEKP